jgi:hypothetical protein
MKDQEAKELPVLQGEKDYRWTAAAQRELKSLEQVKKK